MKESFLTYKIDPKRTFITILATISAILLGIFTTIISNYYQYESLIKYANRVGDKFEIGFPLVSNHYTVQAISKFTETTGYEDTTIFMLNIIFWITIWILIFVGIKLSKSYIFKRGKNG